MRTSYIILITMMIFAAIFYFIDFGSIIPIPAPRNYSGIYLSEEPIQLAKGDLGKESHKIGSSEFELTKLAFYNITAVVVAKKKYSDMLAMMVPYDLALAWGRVPENFDTITFSQKGRFYYYRYSGSCPLSKAYIQSHTSNNHIIVANENLRSGLEKVRTYDLVNIEGYLSNIKVTVGTRYQFMKSSMTRTDSGDGACEVIYLTKLIINNQSVYTQNHTD